MRLFRHQSGVYAFPHSPGPDNMLTWSLQSVPPLYEALQRIWLWIGVEIELPTGGDVNKLAIRDRIPWWEQLVKQVTMREKEFLCLT